MQRFLLLIALAACSPCLPACMDRAIQVDIDQAGKFTDIKRGNGMPARENNEIEVHYTMALPDGTVLVDTRAKGQSHSFRVGDGTVIPGMDQAVRGMRVGGIREVVMPPVAHYGRHGYADVVPPETDLHFRIELLAMRY